MLDGGAEYSMDRHGKYDLGPVAGEREVLVGRESDLAAPAGMRLVRALPRGALIPGTITESDEGADGESSGHLDSVWWCLYAPARVAEEVSSRTSFRRQTLAHHLRRTRYWADRIARFLDLPDLERQAISIAGLWHDQGKARAVWQASIRNLTGEPLAKGPMRPAELGRYRHELGSLLDVRGLPEFEVLPEATRELALHLIAAHHGRARPAFPSEEGFDPERPAADVAVALAAVPVRFDRLQRRYGRWGLAWLESLMRAADALASEDEEEAT
jgi:CRISPR-associated endonuclease/helicase Cas3